MLESSTNAFVALLCGYILTSMFFFKNPTLLYKRKNIKFRCKHISHRGGAGENYENTMVAFRRAVAIGTDMLEIDCYLTKDKQVVVSHDNNLLRCTGVNKNVSDINYKDIPLLNTSLPVDFDPGIVFVGSEKPDERTIPLLSEVFRQFPNLPVNIDIKANNDNLINEIDKLIRQYKRENFTVWGNFSDEVTQKCYLKNPNVNLFFSLRRVLELVFLFYSGLLPFVPIKETHLEIFQPSMYLQPAWKKHKNERTSHFMVKWPNFMIKTMDALFMRKSLFDHLSKRGIQTYIWVLNDEEAFKRVFKLGVTGVMTDYPSRLKKFLQENPQYSQHAESIGLIQ